MGRVQLPTCQTCPGFSNHFDSEYDVSPRIQKLKQYKVLSSSAENSDVEIPTTSACSHIHQAASRFRIVNSGDLLERCIHRAPDMRRNVCENIYSVVFERYHMAGYEGKDVPLNPTGGIGNLKHRITEGAPCTIQSNKYIQDPRFELWKPPA